MDNKKKRYEILDLIRGLNFLMMIAFHTIYDLVYMEGVNWEWFKGRPAKVWQQVILWTFILLSGFCWSFGRKHFKRGMLVFLSGALITFVTAVFMPSEIIIFGVLTFLGSSMLLMIPVEKIAEKIPIGLGLLFSGILVLITRNIEYGELGFGDIHLIKLPEELFHMGDAMTFLGFTDNTFRSSDYVPLLPWFFLYLFGYFLYRLAKKTNFFESNFMKKTAQLPAPFKPITFIGRHSLIVYLLHQPIIYLIVEIIFSL